jgi:hypothetical protein
MAVAYAPVPGGIPAQVFLRPLTNELAIVVARDVQRRLKAKLTAAPASSRATTP